MSDHAELISRLGAALDRIGARVETLGSGGAGNQDDEIKGLNEALEAERNANSQLEERVLAIREKQEKVVARLEEEVELLRLKRADLETELAELRSTLAEQSTGMTASAELVQELSTLKDQRSRDREELDAIIVELSPLFERTSHA